MTASASPGSRQVGATPSITAEATSGDSADLTIGVVDDTVLHTVLHTADLVVGGGERSVLKVVTTDGGQLTSAVGPTGERAIRFPAFSPDEDGPDAVIKVVPAVTDWMSPHLAPLSMGLDLKLDEVSDGTTRDNGDNVLQRGLYVDAAQYKLQLDHHYASCVMRGGAGQVMARVPAELAARHWYRVSCTRHEGTVKLVVATLDGQGEPTYMGSDSETGTIGAMDFDVDSPLSVGGKLRQDGQLARATDQFNGVIDNVHLEIG